MWIAEDVAVYGDLRFYCNEEVQAYEEAGTRYIVPARKPSRLIDELPAAPWTGSPKTHADAQCEFRYQPEGWSRANRFIALCYIELVRFDELDIGRGTAGDDAGAQIQVIGLSG